MKRFTEFKNQIHCNKCGIVVIDESGKMSKEQKISFKKLHSSHRQVESFYPTGSY